MNENRQINQERRWGGETCNQSSEGTPSWDPIRLDATMVAVAGAEGTLPRIVARGGPPQKSIPIFRFVVGPGTLPGGMAIIPTVWLAIV